MESHQAIRINLETAAMICHGYLEDLSDQEMMMRPHPDCNHIKWQVGHLIASENNMMNSLIPGCMPTLPEGFAEKYTAETADNDDPAAFDSKAELMTVAAQQREATLAALAKTTDQQMDAESPEAMRAYAPTVAAALSLQGSHWMMHAGQWVIVRRQLDRPALF